MPPLLHLAATLLHITSLDVIMQVALVTATWGAHEQAFAKCITSSPILIRITAKSSGTSEATAAGNVTTVRKDTAFGAGQGNAGEVSDFLHMLPRASESIVQVVEVVDKKKRDARLLDLLEEYHGAQVVGSPSMGRGLSHAHCSPS